MGIFPRLADSCVDKAVAIIQMGVVMMGWAWGALILDADHALDLWPERKPCIMDGANVLGLSSWKGFFPLVFRPLPVLVIWGGGVHLGSFGESALRSDRRLLLSHLHLRLLFPPCETVFFFSSLLFLLTLASGRKQLRDCVQNWPWTGSMGRGCVALRAAKPRFQAVWSREGERPGLRFPLSPHSTAIARIKSSLSSPRGQLQSYPLPRPHRLFIRMSRKPSPSRCTHRRTHACIRV
jgi:hypothetical protein